MKQRKTAAGNPSNGEGREKPVAAVQRATMVLDAFLEGEGALSLAQLSAITGLYKSTIGRILRTLELQDYVVRTQHGDFHIGPALFQLAARFQRAMLPEEFVLPVLRSLVRQTGESACYVIPRDEDRLMLYRVHSPHAIRDHGLAGDLMPLDRGAAGYIFRAYHSDSAQDAIVREKLMATSRGEIETGMMGMASPVFDRGRECVGAIALTGPAMRFTPESIATWRSKLLGAAQALTVRLGGNGRLFDSALAGEEPST